MASCHLEDQHLISHQGTAEIQRISPMDALCLSRSQQNELAPISELPLDILEAIFSICVSWLYGYSTPTHPLAWTQVCRSWRQASLNSPRLWSRIDLCNSAFANEFLKRSQSVPLSIISISPVKVNVDCLIPHAEQLYSIDVHLFPYDILKLFSGIKFRASTLTKLALQLCPISITSGLFLDIPLPSIRHLVLDGVSVPWDTCQQLTHFSVRGLGTEFSPPVSSLQAIFAKSPHLEYVRLESISPADMAELLMDTTPLIHLKTLIISGIPIFISSILNGITFTPNLRLQLYTSLSTDLHSLFPSGTFPLDNPKDVFTVSSVRLARHAAYFLTEKAPLWSTTSADIRFSISSSTCSAMHVLSSVSSLLNPSLITSIEFSTGVLSDIPEFALRWLLSQIRNLQTLRVAFNDLSALLHILSPSEQQQQNQAVLCPKLNVLSFNKPGDLWWNFAEHWIPPIFDCVYGRHLVGASLHALEFHRCHGMTAEIEDQFQPFFSQSHSTTV